MISVTNPRDFFLDYTRGASIGRLDLLSHAK